MKQFIITVLAILTAVIVMKVYTTTDSNGKRAKAEYSEWKKKFDEDTRTFEKDMRRLQHKQPWEPLN